jgi:hypothetical protein
MSRSETHLLGAVNKVTAQSRHLNSAAGTTIQLQAGISAMAPPRVFIVDLSTEKLLPRMNVNEHLEDIEQPDPDGKALDDSPMELLLDESSPIELLLDESQSPKKLVSKCLFSHKLVCILAFKYNTL